MNWLNMLFSTAFAEEAAAAAGDAAAAGTAAATDAVAAEAAANSPMALIISLLPMVLIFVVFYFMLIRPQRKKDKAVKDMLAALKKIGVQDIQQISSIEIGKKGESGRAVTLRVNGESVSAPELRLALDSTKLRSTLITDIDVQEGKVIFSGKGYGHGVGMPQWGAYGMAEAGKTAEEIVRYYFNGVTVEKLW